VLVAEHHSRVVYDHAILHAVVVHDYNIMIPINIHSVFIASLFKLPTLCR
jgi:hypothetical protein